MLRPWTLEIPIDSQAKKAIYLQIADRLIEAIQSGRLQAGDSLPGSRQLAQRLNVNRNTVVDALDLLLFEGWLVSQERKGTFVAPLHTKLRAQRHPSVAATSELEQVSEPTDYSTYIVLDDGHPDSKIAPMAALGRAYREIFSRKGKWQMMGYGTSLGDVGFREAIAQMLNQQRGMHLHADTLCITRGSQMAMYLLAHCLLKKGEAIVVENPGYHPAWQTFEHAGATLIPIPVDGEGLRVDILAEQLKTNKKIKAVYCTPHRQYPSTVSLSLERRHALIALANSYGFTLIEDDYDNEFHFGYRPILPLSSYGALKNYVYIGTLSKVLAPAVRIGYLASNQPKLIEAVADLRKIIDVQSDSIMEQALLELMKDGTLKRHIRRTSLHYKAKRDAVAALLQDKLKDKADFRIPDGGLAFWVVPHKEVNWEQLSQQLLARGIRLAGIQQYQGAGMALGFRLGYASLSIEQLDEGISRLAELL